MLGPVSRTPPHVHPVGHKWVFVRKRNESNEVKQGLLHKVSLNLQELFMKKSIPRSWAKPPFRHLISMAVNLKLKVKLMDVVTAYLYEIMDSDIYMKIPEYIHVPNQDRANRNLYSVKLRKSLYGLKQSGKMWYNRLKRLSMQESLHEQ